MRPLRASFVVAAAVVVVACKSPTDSVTKDPSPSSANAKSASKPAPTTIPQAEPMIAMLDAAKKSDAKAFRAAYSKRIRDQEEPATWEDHVREAKKRLVDRYGDYAIADFTFSFQGGADRGEVTMVHSSAEPIALDVVREDEGWKLDEH